MWLTCPLDGGNESASRTTTAWLLELPVQQQQLIWSLDRHRNLWRTEAERTETVTSSTVHGGCVRSFVAVMLTFLVAWMVLRNLFGWHKSLNGASGRRRRSFLAAQHCHCSTSWHDFQDYDADYDSDVGELQRPTHATDAPLLPLTEDSEPLFFLSRPPGFQVFNDAVVMVAVNHSESRIIRENDELSSSSLNDFSFDSEETGALLTSKVPYYKTPLISSSLAACYYDPPPKSYNNFGESDSSESFYSPIRNSSSSSAIDSEPHFSQNLSGKNLPG